jgi:LemA protein
MKIVAIGVLVVLLIAGAFALFGVGQYNRLVALDESVGSAWAQVENVYQRRADLVPTLVATVKGSAEFEQETLTAVVEARGKVGQVSFDDAPSAAELEQFQQAQDGLSSALSRLLVVVERYPDIKSTEAFRDLQVQLEGTENRIAVERNRFNEVARAYNTARRSFPTVLLANLFGFAEKPYFEATQGAETAPVVEF